MRRGCTLSYLLVLIYIIGIKSQLFFLGHCFPSCSVLKQIDVDHVFVQVDIADGRSSDEDIANRAEMRIFRLVRTRDIVELQI